MKLDWERDVMPAALREVAELRSDKTDRDELRADLLSVSWELCQSGREFDGVRHLLSVAKLRIKRRMHLDGGSPRSIDGRSMNGEERPKRWGGDKAGTLEGRREHNSPESDGRLEAWLAAMTPRQAEVCQALLSGLTMATIAREWRISKQSVRLTRTRAGQHILKLGVVC
jgi:hypothetical protein